MKKDIDKEAKKVVWSLQNDKRSEVERNIFKQNGKKPMNNNIIYIVTSIGFLLLLSLLLTQLNTKEKEFCFMLDSLCFYTSVDKMLYVLYTFLNLLISIIGIFIAYTIGNKIANKYKT